MDGARFAPALRAQGREPRSHRSIRSRGPAGRRLPRSRRARGSGVSPTAWRVSSSRTHPTVPQNSPASSAARVAASPGRWGCGRLNQRQLGRHHVEGSGREAQPSGNRSPLPGAVGGDPLDGDRRAAGDDQARAAGGMPRQGTRARPGRGRLPPSSAFSTSWRMGTSAAERYQVAVAPRGRSRKASRRSATGGLTAGDRPGIRAGSRGVPALPRPRPRRRGRRAAGRSPRRSGRRSPIRPHLSRELPRSATIRTARPTHPPATATGAVASAASVAGRSVRRRAGRLQELGDPVHQGRDPLAGDGGDRQDLAAQLVRDPLGAPRLRRSGPAWSRPGFRAAGPAWGCTSSSSWRIVR